MVGRDLRKWGKIFFLSDIRKCLRQVLPWAETLGAESFLKLFIPHLRAGNYGILALP